MRVIYETCLVLTLETFLKYDFIFMFFFCSYTVIIIKENKNKIIKKCNVLTTEPKDNKHNVYKKALIIKPANNLRNCHLQFYCVFKKLKLLQ